MTAIVGIINRNGVAFAADSAATVTISDKQKISNHANKIFELSKYEPIGVALCGNMDYRKLPWEQIIKMYRVKLDNANFSSLHEYIMDFFSFVKTLRFDSIDGGNVNLFINSLFDEIYSIAKSNAKKQNVEETDSNIANLMYQELNSIVDMYKEKEVCSNFQGFNIEMFESLFKDSINHRLKDWLTLDGLPNDFEDVFAETLYYILRSIEHVYTTTTVERTN